MTVYANGVYINGSGVIEKLTKRGRGLSNSCQTNQTVTDYNPNVQEIVGTAYGSWTVSAASPIATIKVKLTNMPAGIGEYDVVWHVNGQEFSRQERVLLKENDVISATRDFSSRFDGYMNMIIVHILRGDVLGCGDCVALLHLVPFVDGEVLQSVVVVTENAVMLGFGKNTSTPSCRN